MIAFLADNWDDRLISAINASAAWFACCVHIYVASKFSGHLRLLFMSIGALALFYSLSYWWLFWNPEKVVAWSDFLRPIGIVTWMVAWAVEPFIIYRYMNAQGKKIVKQAEDAAAPFRERLDP